MFCASTALLPSSFAMYAMTTAAASVLAGRPLQTIVAAAIGIVWGWIVAGLAFIPYALYVLGAAPLSDSLQMAVSWLLLTMAPLIVVDRYFYGSWKVPLCRLGIQQLSARVLAEEILHRPFRRRSMYCAWQVSLLNFVRYNVAGGGDSALYGVESPSYYLRNGANQLNLVLPLALAGVPLLLLLGGRPGKRRLPSRVLLTLSPVAFWLAALSALPHKEERFLYPVYPLVRRAHAPCALPCSPPSFAIFLRQLGRKRTIAITDLCVG